MGVAYIAVIVIGGLFSVIGSIMFVVAAFRTSALWGLAVLLLPFAGFVFLCMHWEEAKKPFLINLAGTLMCFVGMMMTLRTGVEAMAAGLPPAAQSFANAAMEAAPKLEQLSALRGSAPDEEEGTGGEDEKREPPKGSPTRLKGKRLEDVQLLLGWPRGRLVRGDETLLVYDGFTLFSDDGETVTDVQLGETYEPVPSEIPAEWTSAAPTPPRPPAE